MSILKIRDEKGEIREILAIRGKDGEKYRLTVTDKEEIFLTLKNSLQSESWTFTLEDGSTVTKAVYVNA